MKKHLLPLALFLFFATQTKAQKPVANFSWSTDTICPYDCVNFTDLSSNSPTHWEWWITGDDIYTELQSELQNAQICFGPATSPNDTSYSISLIVSNSSGSDTLTRNDIITEYPFVTPCDLGGVLGDYDSLFCPVDPSYVSYQWYFNDTLIAGATSPLYIATKPGNYSVKVMNGYGCTITTCVEGLFGSCCGGTIGLNNFLDKHLISLSPNPATNQLTIQTSSFHNEAATLSIINLLGQTSPPAPLQMERGVAAIDVWGLPSGIYFVQLTTEKERWVGKFVKE